MELMLTTIKKLQLKPFKKLYNKQYICIYEKIENHFYNRNYK